MTINWPRFVDVVRSHQRFLLTSHVRPDCDALGSELGMALILEALGKAVTIVNGQETPPNLAFIDPHRRIGVLGLSAQPAALHADVLMILDTSAWQQLGPMAEIVRSSQAKRLVLDHHVSADDLGAEEFKDTDAEATGRLVVDAADALGVSLSAAMAEPLFAAIATDTGWFRFASTRPATYRVAARLVEAGADPPAIYNALYERETLGRIKLRGEILARATTELGGRLVHTYVLVDDFARTGSLPSDTEDAINLTLTVAGVEFAVIFVQQAGGGFKVSFRSRCAVDCSKLAEQFGGGGHKAAAGAFVPGTLEEARARVLDAVRAAMR
jgi:phosphoesterase RecJ-like protein